MWRCPFGVEPVVAEQEGVVDGRALGFVDGHGVAVVEMAGVEVARRDDDRVVDDDRPVFGVDGGDGAGGPVGEAEAAVVAPADDPVPHRELQTAAPVGPVDGDGGSGELSVGSERVAGQGVELGDVGPAQGVHDRCRAGRVVGLVPVGDHRRSRCGGGVGDGDSAVGGVGVERSLRLAGPEPVEGVVFPDLGLAAVDRQLVDAGLGGEAAETAAGGDLR